MLESPFRALVQFLTPFHSPTVIPFNSPLHVHVSTGPCTSRAFSHNLIPFLSPQASPVFPTNVALPRLRTRGVVASGYGESSAELSLGARHRHSHFCERGHYRMSLLHVNDDVIPILNRSEFSQNCNLSEISSSRGSSDSSEFPPKFTFHSSLTPIHFP